MKINPITLCFNDLLRTPEKREKAQIDYKTIKPFYYPKEYYLSFQGGASLSLKQTVANLQKGKNNFPVGIEETALSEIKKGNPHNKKLIDIHKEKYREVNDCDSIEELKFFFPEFSDVKSLDEDKIDFIKGSLIDKFLKGEIKTKNGELFLNPEKDLTLQLVQMYWGDCLSLTDISNACGHNFSATMEKLNIPTFTPIYGQYLKLSDEEKNKAITEAAARNRSVNENFAKRKGIPLSEEHKKKISQALKSYYAAHKQMQFGLNEEDANYFARNPYQSEIFTEILKRAWNYHDSKSIKKALSKYMKKNDTEINENVLRNPTQALTLKGFWDTNSWAKSKWSDCMTKSWARQKVLEKMGLIHEPQKFYQILGTTFTNMLALALKEVDSDFSILKDKDIKDLLSVAIPDSREQVQYNATSLRNIFKAYGQTIINCNLDCQFYSVPEILNSIFKLQIEKAQNKPFLSKESSKLLKDMKAVQKSIDMDLIKKYKENRTPEGLLKVLDMYIEVAMLCMRSESKELSDIFDNTMKELFSKNKSGLSNGMTSALTALYDASTMQDKEKIQENLIKEFSEKMKKNNH